MSFAEITHNWNPPESLGYSSLRPVRLARGGIAIATIAVVVTIGGMVLGAVIGEKSRRQAVERDLLRDQGLVTEATVLRVWRSGGEDSEHRVRYSFEVRGREILASHSAPSAIWRTLEEGSRLPVRYVPANPAINHPTAWNPGVVPWFIALLVPLMFLGMAGLMTFLIRGQWRLLSEGRPAPGIVTGYRKSDKAVSVLYEFRLLNGATRKGRGTAGGRRKTLPPIGSVVCVLYDPENPRRNGLYPFPFVRLVGN
jgi:hypothetical protein